MILTQGSDLTITGEMEAGSLDINGISNISGEAFFTGAIDVTSSSHSTRFRDGHKVHFNTGRTASIYTSSDDLYIENGVDDKDIIFQSDDGSGGTTAYLTLDGSAGHTVANKEINFEDNVKATFGTAADLDIYHNGTDTFFDNATGNMKFVNYADDKDIIFYSDDGSGGLATYFQLDGSSATHDGSATTALITRFPDNSKIYLGTGDDGRLYHNGTDTYLQNTTGDLIIQNFADDKDVVFKCDDGSGGTETYFYLDGSTGYTQFPDSKQLAFGSDNDMRIYSSGSTNFIISDVGDLSIQQKANDKDIIFKCDDGSGGTTPYLTLDGGSEEVVFSKPIVTAETQIKVLPHQFMSNEDGGQNKSVQFRDDTIIGVRATSNDAELYAFVEIPYGKTATNVTVYGNDTNLVVNVYESDINAGALTDRTPAGS
jgi:hypothetical protein